MALPNSSPKPRILPPVKPPRIIVEHFDIGTYKVDRAKGYVEANCQHCGATIRGQRNVTSNFIQHMRRRHPNAYDKFAASSTHRVKRPRLTPSKAPPPSAPLPSPAIAAPPPPPTQNEMFEPPRPSPRPRSQSTEVVDRPRPEFALENALVSATYRAAKRTSCDLAPGLSQRTGCQVYVKREDQQVSGNLIFRAAYNHIAANPTSRGGLIVAGKAALPVAVAARMHSKSCLVVLPTSAPPAVVRKIAACEAKHELAGHTDEECITVALAKANGMNRTYVDLTPPRLVSGCSDAAAGYATMALELLQQRQHVDRIFMAGGNAPLFMGVSSVLQRVGRGVKLIGVVSDEFDSAAGPSNEEGTESSDPANSWEDFVESVVRVNQPELSAAVEAVFEDCDGCLLEPSGVLSVAGAIKYTKLHKMSHERLVCVVDTPLRQFDLLRMVTSRSWRADGNRCLLRIQPRGVGESTADEYRLTSFMSELLSMEGGPPRITCLRYGGKWPLLLGLRCDVENTATTYCTKLGMMGYDVIDLSENDLTEDDMWTWEKEENIGEKSEVEGETMRWAVFRVTLRSRSNDIATFLAVRREECHIARVSYSSDGGNVTRLLVAAAGTEVQLRTLQSDMASRAEGVERIRTALGGVSVLGCVDVVDPIVNGHVVGDGNLASQHTPNGPMCYEVQADVHQVQQQGAEGQHHEDVATDAHHGEHVEHVSGNGEHDEAMQEHIVHQGAEQADAAITHDPEHQQGLHQQHELVHHEGVQHEDGQETIHADQVQHDGTQGDEHQHELPQDDTAHAHHAVQHDGSQHEDIQQKDTEHEQQGNNDDLHSAAVQLEGQQGSVVDGERGIVVNEGENEANDLEMSFADGEGDVTVAAASREMEEGENDVQRQDGGDEEEGHRNGEGQMQETEDAGRGEEVERGQATGDVEMHEVEGVEGDAEVLEVNSQSQMEGQNGDGEVGRGEEGVQGSGEEHEIEESVMAAAAVAAAEAVGVAQMGDEDSR